MDLEKIKQLIKLLHENNLDEIEFSEGEETIRIKGQSAAPSAQTSSVQQASFSGEASRGAPLKTSETKGHKVCSPMVGTVYLAPAPDKDPYVSVGQKVSVGDTLCIVEAMKQFNSIEADKAGVIKARLVENGSPVEFDQVLFIIE